MEPYYADDSVTIYLGDCREIELPQPDHVITDPPYDTATHKGARTGNRKTELVRFDSILFVGLRDALASYAPTRWCVLTMALQHASLLERDTPEGLRYVRIGVWDKQGTGAPQFTGDRPGTGWEAVAHLHREGVKMRWNGGGRDSIYRHPVARGYHPTQKPLTLLTELVSLFTDPGELILDPFMGSGTTLRAAKDLGRRAIGIEREEKWCEIAANRMRQEVLL